MRFVLVPGSMHGAWCFDLLIPELVRLGHEATSMDLPGQGARHADTPTLAGYREAVVDKLRPGDVVVGHSMGCAPATMAVDSHPDIAHIVYLAGSLPFENRPMIDAMQTGLDDAHNRVPVTDGFGAYAQLCDDGASFRMDDTAAVACFYHDCDAQITTWALPRLTTQAMAVAFHEAVSVAQFWKLNPPRVFIQCADDRAILPPVSALQAERLGVEPVSIAGSHSPFFSRPAELARILVSAVPTDDTALQPD